MEIFSFLDAQLVAPGVWRLSNLLRGLGGAEYRAGLTIAAGADVILLDSAIIPLTDDIADAGLLHRYRVGPADRDYADASYSEITASAGMQALKPYAPVRARASRTATGVQISFLRRGRIDSDAWEPVNIPLGEETEQYEVDIYNGSVIVRTLTGVTTEILYPQASEISDFGSLQTQIDLAIFQISTIAGRGYPLRALVQIV